LPFGILLAAARFCMLTAVGVTLEEITTGTALLIDGRYQGRARSSCASRCGRDRPAGARSALLDCVLGFGYL
jgi:hypothetical protein